MKEESFMTKFQKQMLTIAAAGALTAVTALPAMAFENEFHGLYNFNTVFSNYNNGLGGDINPGTAGTTTLTNYGDKRKMNNYMEQRGRIQYIAKASDDLKMVTNLEFNTRFGATASGGDLDTDGPTAMVLKHMYLDFNVGKNFNTKLGMQAYKDSIKGIFIDADLPAVMTTTKMGAYTLNLGFGRYADDQANAATTSFSRAGDANKDIFIMDNTFAFSKATKAALSYYYVADYAATNTGYNGAPNTTVSGAIFAHTADQAIQLHTFALSGETKFGGLNLSGFAAMQAGNQRRWQAAAFNNDGRNFHGWAANVAADMKVGSGKAKTGFLFTSGNNSTNNAHYNGWVSSSVASYNESGMVILARNTNNSPTSTDAYIRRDIQNIALFTMGYDAQLTDKFNLDTNVGMAWAPASQSAPIDQKIGGVNRYNNSDYMGTEINMTAGYQLYKNLKLQAQAGYVMLGGYYKNSTMKNGSTVINAANAVDPENPYTMRLQARYSF
jgi:hypothetical protein